MVGGRGGLRLWLGSAHPSQRSPDPVTFDDSSMSAAGRYTVPDSRESCTAIGSSGESPGKGFVEAVVSGAGGCNHDPVRAAGNSSSRRIVEQMQLAGGDTGRHQLD